MAMFLLKIINEGVEVVSPQKALQKEVRKNLQALLAKREDYPRLAYENKIGRISANPFDPCLGFNILIRPQSYFASVGKYPRHNLKVSRSSVVLSFHTALETEREAFIDNCYLRLIMGIHAEKVASSLNIVKAIGGKEKDNYLNLLWEKDYRNFTERLLGLVNTVIEVELKQKAQSSQTSI